METAIIGKDQNGQIHLIGVGESVNVTKLMKLYSELAEECDMKIKAASLSGIDIEDIKGDQDKINKTFSLYFDV